MRDTIFALATPPARSAVAIFRVSGPGAKAMLTTLCRPLPQPRTASLRKIASPDGETIDEGLVLWFPGPNSFTGEDVFELQLHGGPAVLDATIKTLRTLDARPAEPGEFTRRAFEAGRLDLSQAEAVADLVDAETEAQRRQALEQLGGHLIQRGQAWREVLLTALSFLEAQIDFPDEDVPAHIAEQARAPLLGLAHEIEAALGDARGERIREGMRIALIGAPNAGKSSLLNALLGRDAAIVTAIPGATRDVIEAPLMVEGYKVLLADMAGIREATDAVEIEGVRRARAWAEQADLRLWLVDPDDQTGEWRKSAALVQPGDVLILAKSDKGASVHGNAVTLARDLGLTSITTSTLKPGGTAPLLTFLKAWVTRIMSGHDVPLITQQRHRMLLTEAKTHLDRALSRKSEQAELVAEDVRLVARSLEKLSGRVGAEDVLDRVFASFCIGK